MTQNLLEKYNVPVPRYTSYPPANYFNDTFNDWDYVYAIDTSNDTQPEHLSFYFHIPFCFKLCHYCGCNSYPIAKPDLIDRYVAALHQEIDLVIPRLNRKRKIAQIHYGGGTPTVLPAIELRELNDHLRNRFAAIPEPEIAIECHPGYLSERAWIEMVTAGFNRFSLGIQDFNKDVLKMVNRQRPKLQPEEIVKTLRSFGVQINMDFIYGLPGQTEESFAQTIERAIQIKPDRLVTFSYAHVPWVNPRQLILEKAGLPASEEKSRMYETARRILCEAGYKPIGMDHFVLEGDELDVASQNKQLHRNFQGYCTRRTTGQVYAFGVTGISQLSTAYAQNTKDIMEYIERIENGQLATAKGHILNEDEQITREVITSLMCNYVINWEEISEQLAISVEQIKQALNYDETRLQEFVDEGIISRDFNKNLVVTDQGRPFVRNIAAMLDKMMLHSTKSFSKPV